jgi:hypothetical protein
MLGSIGMGKVDPLMQMAADHELDVVLILAQQRVQAIITELRGNILNKREVNEEEGRFALLELSLEPLQLLLAERTRVGIEVRRCMVLGATEEVIQMDEFVTFMVQD